MPRATGAQYRYELDELEYLCFLCILPDGCREGCAGCLRSQFKSLVSAERRARARGGEWLNKSQIKYLLQKTGGTPT